MSIALLEICEWHGTRRRDRVVRNPSLLDVREAVQALDGKTRNDVYLHVRPDAPTPYLCIGGGPGRYVVTGAEADDSFPTLVDPRRAGAPEESLCVGGQAGSYPGHWVQSLETALRAAEFFWRTGQFGGTELVWERG